MKEKRQQNLINILSLVLVLVCLFMPIIGVTDSWFTYQGANLVEIEANMTGVEIKLYHTSVSDSNPNNEILPANSATSYIPLSGEITPDTAIPLTLIVKNIQAASIYVKFKFEVYADGATDTLIPCSLTNSNYTASGSYWVYGDTTAGDAVSQNGTITLMTAFTIDYDDFETIGDSETIKLKLEVVASSVAFS